MKLTHLPLRSQQGRLVIMRLEQLPASSRTHTHCACGSQDSGLRIITDDCSSMMNMPFGILNAAWQRLAHFESTPRMLCDVLIVLLALPADEGTLSVSFTHGWAGRDVRPWLADRAARRCLLAALQPHWKKTVKMLVKDFPETLPLLEISSAEASSIDLAHLLLDGERKPMLEPAASPRAARVWLPWLRQRGLAWDAVLESWAAALSEGHEPDREALVARMLQEARFKWFPLLARQLKELRLPLMRVLVETKQHLQLPPAGMHSLLQTLTHAIPRSAFAATALKVMRSLENGCTPRFIAKALRFHRRWELEFHPLSQPAHDPCLRQIHQAMNPRIPDWLRYPHQIWKQSTKLRDWSSAISRLFARPLHPDIQESVLQRMRGTVIADGRAAPYWSRWLQHWDEFLHEASQTPPALIELATGLIESLWRGYDHDSRTPHDAGHLIRWLRRIRDFKKAPGTHTSCMIYALWSTVGREEEEALLNLPESVWKQMQPALIGYSSCDNAEDGIKSAKDLPSGCLLGMLASSPLEWLRIMRRIGELTARERGEIWQAFREHPLVSCNLARMSLEEAIVLVDTIQASHAGLPGVPDKLRTHAKAMPAHVLAHYRGELLGNAQRLRLAVLKEIAEWSLRRRFPALQGEIVSTHTLRLVAASGERNARAMRQLLRSCQEQQDKRSWTLQHPRNQSWLHRQPSTRRELWMEGFVVEKEVQDVGVLQLGPEDDLQAILRMGTEFGTCLSAGSFNSFSTAANALDANKRVLYARDAKGKPWARQLVAISESGHLVCFPVYARQQHAQMRDLFGTYDHTLAHLLRLPLWRTSSYADIAPLVCKDWYDDGPWTL
ncbi:hypothetical protein [Brevifollis gellanilyticus]|uniref:Uncharacterized protein n=1 Tax=Brevifollis gellanilyticus TaxID=748831 RepID=A0A512MAK8_9BACT|nr:hypothetical protein [Brevifollis gellanilyticus]GEP43769.1 hypothetical protein BGE01nite_30600 [Brevifollis gellanilyticus]